MTLEQIFIENRLYKAIEECSTLEEVRTTVSSSLVPFLVDYKREVTLEDIDRLLSLKIRRISRFDIEAHKKEIGDIRSKMRVARKKLKNLIDYAVDVLQTLLDKYGKLFPRQTSIETFSGIDKREVAIANLKLGYDPQTGFIGTAVKGEKSWNVSELDRILYFLADGTYKVVPVQEKLMMTGKVLWCGPCDKEKVFACVYRDKKSRIAYVKRFAIGGYILDREYPFMPENSELMVFLERENVLLDYWFERRRNMKTRKGETLLSEVTVKGVKAKGIQLCGKKIVSTLKAIEINDEPEIPANKQEPEPEEDIPELPEEPRKTLEEITEEADALKSRMSNILKKFESGTPDLFGDSE